MLEPWSSTGLFSVLNLAISAALRPSLNFLYLPFQSFCTQSSWMILFLLISDLSSAWLQPLEGPTCWLCSHCSQLAWRYREKETTLWAAWAFLVNKGSRRRRCKMLAMYECFTHRTACKLRSRLKTEMLKKMLTAAKFMRRRGLHEWEGIWRRREQGRGDSVLSMWLNLWDKIVLDSVSSFLPPCLSTESWTPCCSSCQGTDSAKQKPGYFWVLLQ